MTGTAGPITSPANPRIKRLRGLSLRKHRNETGLFLVEGQRLVQEGLATGAVLDTMVMHQDLLAEARMAPLIEAARAAGADLLPVSTSVLEKVSRKDNPQTLIAAFRQRWTDLENVDPGADFAWIALQGIRDPGNLGTILRTADAAGAAGVILIDQTCDPWSIEAVRASMGSIFALSLARTDFAGFVAWRRRWPAAHLVGTALPAAVDYQVIRYRRPLLLMMGTEQSGLAAEHVAACDDVVRIPMRGRADSLNLAVATAVVLYEAYNQDRRATD